MRISSLLLRNRKMVTIPPQLELNFNKEFEPNYGKSVRVSNLIRRVVAPNPGPFTFKGTGTYIVGNGQVAIIDPGPDIEEHIESLLNAVKGETVSHILVTHTHVDHSPACKPLQKKLSLQSQTVPIYAYGPHATYGEDVEAGADIDFMPDKLLENNDIISGPGWTIEVVHTPGHTSNHLCFRLKEEKTLFTGDHIMGWSTTIVSPPDGDMATYIQSLRNLLESDDVLFVPTHGAPITKPHEYLLSLIKHRETREQQILACVSQGLNTIQKMVEVMYSSYPVYIHPAAAQSVLAHTIHMVRKGALEVVSGSSEGISPLSPSLDSVYTIPLKSSL